MSTKRAVLFFFLLLFIGVPAFGLLNSFIYNQKQGGRPNLLMERQMIGSAGKMAAGTDSAPAGMPVPEVAMDMARSSILPVPPYYGDTGFVPGDDRTIVKTANLSVVVEDTRQTVEKVNQNVKDLGGVVTSSNIYENEFTPGVVQASMVIRVPVEKLDETLNKLRGLANKVTQESVNADDRTKQKVDLEARLKNLRASEEQLLSIMRQAQNVQETLQVQQQLTQVREQIEMLTAQLENLSGDAAMSTIQLQISTQASEAPVVGSQENSIWDEIKLAFKDMIRLYRGLFIDGVKTLIILSPVIVLAVVGWFIWQRLRSRTK